MRKKFYIIYILVATGLACSLPSQILTPTSIPTQPTNTPAATFTAESTSTSTITTTPTITFTPTISPTPTFAFPTVTVNKQAHCRYGPSVAYLHAADLYAGDVGSVRGRAFYSNWLFIKFDKLNYFCWVAPSVIDLVGDISNIKKIIPDLQSIGSNQYGPPNNVSAVRDGDKVTISWDQVEMTQDKDRGYFIEAFVCQKGFLLWWTFSYPDQFTTSYTVKDEAGCSSPSYGQLYTVEKHGYSKPVDIPWPKP
jgi:hypothetical protein